MRKCLNCEDTLIDTKTSINQYGQLIFPEEVANIGDYYCRSCHTFFWDEELDSRDMLFDDCINLVGINS